MKFIVISPPGFIPGEAVLIKQLFDAGMDTLHLRKPEATIDDCARLLDEIPQELHRNIVIHDNFRLCDRYELQGVHLNSRNTIPPKFSGHRQHTVSASCHTLQEAAMRKDNLDYVFISPIFNSISKQGYSSAFSQKELDMAAEKGITDDKTIALGGISYGMIRQLRKWHFGGAAFLGDVWEKAGRDDFALYAERLSVELHG
ncbi:thiamine phosphate synthase [Xylanibacter muris]|uniref:Thiamine phosphate synthase n=1 Tax=Xylanibacter muris TaxID=2736290 RepID=A0ABX2AP85_9BACT|nr:thiamine phosphate synthase [Xylanibacter muris]NPD93061.1 thiamine phosphate synthase [Xylanibacter muris]